MRHGRGGASKIRLVDKKTGVDRKPYCLQKSEINPTLMAQLAGFRRFLTTKFYGTQKVCSSEVLASS